MQGYLRKMTTELSDPVQYQLPVSDELIALNPLLGQTLTLQFTGQIACVHCGRQTKKSFNQGYCYPCFTRLAQCDMCIMKPETCHYALGTCREPEWGDTFCFQTHYVYLANASGIKVGITRQNQIPVRWIDQGAVQALPIFKVSSRHLSGLIEVEMAKHVSDKTSWQKMLKNQQPDVDLKARRDELQAVCEPVIADIQQRMADAKIEKLPEADLVDIHYPVIAYPEKVKSLNPEKNPKITGQLQGIKGQYLILDTGVINIRKYSGYEIKY
jgi:hypothetical protein